MLVPAASAYDYILALHIIAVVLAFTWGVRQRVPAPSAHTCDRERRVAFDADGPRYEPGAARLASDITRSFLDARL